MSAFVLCLCASSSTTTSTGNGAITTELGHIPQSSTSPPPHLPRVSTACFSHSRFKPQGNIQASEMHKLQGRPESQEETPRSPSPLFCMKMAYSQRKQVLFVMYWREVLNAVLVSSLLLVHTDFMLMTLQWFQSPEIEAKFVKARVLKAAEIVRPEERHTFSNISLTRNSGVINSRFGVQ